ncbi:hypothetical protein TeGR_g7412, partial [Tetraparma gracilis]
LTPPPPRYVTVPDAETADAISAAAVSSRAAACVSQLPGLTSVYAWKGAVERGSEVLLMIKTRTALLGRLERLVRELHPYETMEFIAVPVEKGGEDYLQWIRDSTGGGRP